MKLQKTIMVFLTAALLAITPLSAMAGKGGKGGKVKPPIVELSAWEEDLLFMREEEKLARDVYVVMYDLWDAPIFFNISEAEQSHMDALKKLVVKYELTDPVGDDIPGVFDNPVLDTMYNGLVVDGSASLIAALGVGITIEEVDIFDLKNALLDKDLPDDVIRTYENLLQGSYNHLRAFVSQWESLAGEEYEPIYLTDEEADAILDGSTKRNRGRRGR